MVTLLDAHLLAAGRVLKSRSLPLDLRFSLNFLEQESLPQGPQTVASHRRTSFPRPVARNGGSRGSIRWGLLRRLLDRLPVLLEFGPLLILSLQDLLPVPVECQTV